MIFIELVPVKLGGKNPVYDWVEKLKINISKKIFSVLLTLTFLLSFNVIPAKAEGICSGNIYWSNVDSSDPGSLGRAVIAESVIASVNNSYSTPTKVVYEIEGDTNFLYYNDSGGILYNLNKDTGVETALKVFPGYIYSLALRDGQLYAGGDGYLKTFSVGADGTLSSERDVYASLGFGVGTTYLIEGIAVSDDYLYYGISDFDVAGENFIGRIKLDESEPAEPSFIPLPVTLDNPTHMEVDSNYIYWNWYTIGLKRADLNGENITTLIETNRNESFDIDSNYIYLDNWNGSDPFTIARANLDGTELDLDYITTDVNPYGVHVETNQCAPSGDSDSSGDSNSSPPTTVATIAPAVLKTADVVFNLKNKKYLSKDAMKTKLSKNKSFKRNPEDLYKYSIFKASKKTCAIQGNYVTSLKKTGTCDLYATRTTTKGVKYKYWVQINYTK
jgi:hypothetical protein